MMQRSYWKKELALQGLDTLLRDEYWLAYIISSTAGESRKKSASHFELMQQAALL